VTRVGRPKAKRTKRRESGFVLVYRREEKMLWMRRREEKRVQNCQPGRYIYRGPRNPGSYAKIRLCSTVSVPAMLSVSRAELSLICELIFVKEE